MALSQSRKQAEWVLLFLVVSLLIWLGVLVGNSVFKTDTHAPAKTVSQHKEQRVKPTQPKPAFAFPDGSQKLFPGHRLVALYGSPRFPVLGILGEQSAEQAVHRAQDLARQYQTYTTERVMPSFEIITTVASSTPTGNNDYSNELDINAIKPWVETARAHGVYVVLDLQPGRADFLTQAKQYEPLLREPHVGLALDPEWRLAPNQVPLAQIGSVDASEVNAVAAWLSDITKQDRLPQKLFLLHQFRNSMITNRSQLHTTHDELAYVIQMDGNGAQTTKQGTWAAIRRDAPANVRFGWKNFIDEDHPMLTPDATMHLEPRPWYISYQ
jgi:hypothetical protein